HDPRGSARGGHHATAPRRSVGAARQQLSPSDPRQGRLRARGLRGPAGAGGPAAHGRVGGRGTPHRDAHARARGRRSRVLPGGGLPLRARRHVSRDSPVSALSAVVLVALTSLATYLLGTRRLGLPRPGLGNAVQATLETIGMGVVFLMLNL